MFQLFDYYACNGTCLLFLSVFESLALGWLFGKYLRSMLQNEKGGHRLLVICFEKL